MSAGDDKPVGGTGPRPQGTSSPNGHYGRATGNTSSSNTNEPDDGPGLSDFIRKAVSAGVGAATKSRQEVFRVAAGEVRSWLDKLDLDKEIVRALCKTVVEVKTEVRFRPREDGGVTPEAKNEVAFTSRKPPEASSAPTVTNTTDSGQENRKTTLIFRV